MHFARIAFLAAGLSLPAVPAIGQVPKGRDARATACRERLQKERDALRDALPKSAPEHGKPVAPRPGPEQNAKIRQLERLMLYFTKTSFGDKEPSLRLQEFLDRAAEVDPRVSTAMAMLKANKIALLVRSAKEEKLCGSGTAAFYDPGLRKVVLCSRDMYGSRIIQSLLHESLHALQHFADQRTREEAMTYSFRGKTEKLQRAIDYHISGEFYDTMVRLDKSAKESLALIPKKDDVRKQTYALISRIIEANPLLRFEIDGAGKLSAKVKLPPKTTRKELDTKLPEEPGFSLTFRGLGEWIQDRKEKVSGAEHVEAYGRFLEESVRELLATESLEGEERAAIVKSMGTYVKLVASVRPLFTFCVEMQTHIDDAVREYLLFREAGVYAECRNAFIENGIEDGDTSNPYAEVYRHGDDFDRVTRDLERFAKGEVNGALYGEKFSLWGYSAFPDEFSAERCRRAKPPAD